MNMGNDQRWCESSSSSSPSKKNKSKIKIKTKSNNSVNIEKPRVPQRGLGVAQLEKIRLHTQMANNCGLLFPQHHHLGIGFPTSPLPMGVEEHLERTSKIRFAESHPSITASPNSNAVTVSESHEYDQPQEGLVTRHFLSHDEKNDRKDHLIKSNGSSCYNNSDSSYEKEDLDLELKL